MFTDTLWIKIFAKIAHGFRDTSIFVFCDFCEKFGNSKWPQFLEGQNFLKIGSATQQIFPVGQKFIEIALSRTVYEIQAFLKKI